MTRSESCCYKVAIGKHAIYVRVSGLASMTNCLCVRDFLDEMLKSCRHFIIMDLAECTGMDSTFMGVIAGAASFIKNEQRTGLAVVNAGKSLVRLLEEVGISELVLMDPKPFAVPDVEFFPLQERDGEEERLALIRSAHQHLIATSEQNAKIFGPLIAQLEAQMKQHGLL